ncbi:hypothetical protein [Nocardioides montaniterrae]
MSDAAPPRPGQATFAALLIGVGSVLAIAVAWERIAGLYTIEMQDTLAKLAKDEPFGGMSAEGLATTFRILCVIGGGASAAATILAVQAWQRSKGARVALTCLVPLIIAGWMGTSGFFEPIVLAGIALLWMPPTRDWFEGREWQPAVRGGYGPAAGPTPVLRQPRQPADGEKPVARPPGESAPPWASAPPPTTDAMSGPVPAQWSGSAYEPLQGPTRPPAMVWACTLTWIGTALVGGLLAVTAALLAFAHDQYFKVVRDRGMLEGTGISEHQLQTSVIVAASIGIPACLLAALLAVGVMLGRPVWARLLLAALSSIVGIACVALALVNPPMVLPGLVALLVAFLLARPEVVEWRPKPRT